MKSPPSALRVGLRRWRALLSATLVLAMARVAAGADSAGFALPEAGHAFSFPKDYGSHPDFRLEWWYLTGHAFAAGGRRFGFEATFFRSALARSTAPAAPSPLFGSSELYLAHMALLDVSTGKFIHQERLNRDGWDAGAEIGRLGMHNGPWSLSMDPSPSQQMTLHGGIRNEASFDFTLRPAKPLVVFGKDGVSRKGASPEAASYYLTFPRLRLSGTLATGRESLTVGGEAWMDHEISSSQLDPAQVGWDWACLQLKDGEELMAYRMRRADGKTDPFSTLAWIDRAGAVAHLGPAQFGWEALETWRSPATGANYPLRIRLAVGAGPHAGRTFVLEPLARDQELSGGPGGIAYWEGACRVLDGNGTEVGSAFLELTGYDRRLKL